MTIIIAAHGTRSQAGQASTQRVAEEVSRAAGQEVKVGWIDLLEPTLAEVLDGVDAPVVVPWLVGGGYHLLVDVERVVAEVSPTAVVTPPLGESAGLVDALVDRLRDADGAEPAAGAGPVSRPGPCPRPGSHGPDRCPSGGNQCSVEGRRLSPSLALVGGGVATLVGGFLNIAEQGVQIPLHEWRVQVDARISRDACPKSFERGGRGPGIGGSCRRSIR